MPSLILTADQARTIRLLADQTTILAAVVPRRTADGFWRDVYLAVPLDYAPGGYIRVPPSGAGELSGGYYHAADPESWFRMAGRGIVALAEDVTRRAALAARFVPIPATRAIIPHPTLFGAGRYGGTALRPGIDLSGDALTADLLREIAATEVRRQDRAVPFITRPPYRHPGLEWTHPGWDVSDEAFAPLVPPSRRVIGVDLGEADAATLAVGEATLDGKRIILSEIRRVPAWSDPPDLAGPSAILETIRRAMAASVAASMDRLGERIAGRMGTTAAISFDDLRRQLEKIVPPVPPPFPFRVYDPDDREIGTIPPPYGLVYRPALSPVTGILSRVLTADPAASPFALMMDLGRQIADGLAALAADLYPPPAPRQAPPSYLRFAPVGVRIDRRGRARYCLQNRRRG
jgi:hypothetical protein